MQTCVLHPNGWHIQPPQCRVKHEGAGEISCRDQPLCTRFVQLKRLTPRGLPTHLFRVQLPTGLQIGPLPLVIQAPRHAATQAVHPPHSAQTRQSTQSRRIHQGLPTLVPFDTRQPIGAHAPRQARLTFDAIACSHHTPVQLRPACWRTFGRRLRRPGHQSCHRQTSQLAGLQV